MAIKTLYAPRMSSMTHRDLFYSNSNKKKEFRRRFIKLLNLIYIDNINKCREEQEHWIEIPAANKANEFETVN